MDEATIRRKMEEFLTVESPPIAFDRLDDYVHQDVKLPKDLNMHGLADFKEKLASYKSVLEYKIDMLDLIVEGNKAATRRRIYGKQVGPFSGFNGIGKDFSIEEIVIAHWRDGKIAQLWRVADMLSMERQLNAV